MNDKYILPQAAQDTLGGIKAAAVEDKYTQECKIDKETGKLYTRSADRFLIEDTFEGNPVMSSSCREGNISLIEGYGQSTQVTTEGKNLVDIPEINKELPQEAYDVDVFFDKPVVVKIGKYNYTTKKSIWRFNFNKQDGSSVYLADDTILNNKFLSIDASVDNPITKITYRNTYITSGSLSEVQVEYGTIPTEYEPYTGGQPSPSPDYPQEIKDSVATGIKVTGKNLFDEQFCKVAENWIEVPGGYSYIPIFVGKGNTVTFSTSGNPQQGLGFYCALSKYKKELSNKVYSWIYHSTSPTLIKTEGTFVVTESDYIYFSLNTGAGNINKFLSAYPDFQIEISPQKTYYMPYQGQSIQLSTSVTLRGIPSESGNVTIDGQKYLSDYIGQKEGVYGVFRRFFVYEVTGNEDFGSRAGTYVEEGSFNAYFSIRKYVSEAKIETPGYVKWGLCNNLIFNANSWTKKGEIGFCYNYGQLHIRVKNETISATQEMEISQKTQLLKDYLKNLYDSGTPMIFLYPLATEIFESLPEPDQQALKGLKTFYPTSIISLETEDNSGACGKAILKQDMKLYIQNKIKELSNNSIAQIQNINLNLIR